MFKTLVSLLSGHAPYIWSQGYYVQLVC